MLTVVLVVSPPPLESIRTLTF